jgi:hypothetical protein
MSPNLAPRIAVRGRDPILRYQRRLRVLSGGRQRQREFVVADRAGLELDADVDHDPSASTVTRTRSPSADPVAVRSE